MQRVGGCVSDFCLATLVLYSYILKAGWQLNKNIRYVLELKPEETWVHSTVAVISDNGVEI